ncbi:hypothetical protein SAMN02744124_02718 [Paenibacillus barengoltzii J12]|uniref:Uncharacterized protein n=3 Tax=Paenibacillus barengoltzii TaxID=343517 RepID=R9LBV1_9BACL|nr:hypothetical protein C812_02411 [Paenibacillus barengoltzii G22]SMF38099.1 hypothetical protein SAMN02744124_02718 [Paenibacillus barengoltzii J12]
MVKKIMKSILWGLLGIAILGIVIGFATDHFTLAYRIMLVLFLVFSGWGTFYYVKNHERQYLDDYRRYNRSYDNITREDDLLR